MLPPGRAAGAGLHIPPTSWGTEVAGHRLSAIQLTTAAQASARRWILVAQGKLPQRGFVSMWAGVRRRFGGLPANSFGVRDARRAPPRASWCTEPVLTGSAPRLLHMPSIASAKCAIRLLRLSLSVGVMKVFSIVHGSRRPGAPCAARHGRQNWRCSFRCAPARHGALRLVQTVRRLGFRPRSAGQALATRPRSARPRRR